MITSDAHKKEFYLHVYLGKLKGKWIDYCKLHDERPGAAVKRIICILMSKSSNSPAMSTETIGKADRSRRRIEVRLTDSEFEKLDCVSERDGLTINQYLVHLVRHHLVKKPQLAIPEIEALTESNFQLLALGRNLNQIARALNAEDPDEHRPTLKEIKVLLEKIYSHTHLVSNLISANLERWKIE
jgi:hypothetical protein